MRLAIVAASYVFYSGGEPLFVGLLLASSCVDFFAALRMHASTVLRVRRMWLAASVAVNLGILGLFNKDPATGTYIKQARPLNS